MHTDEKTLSEILSAHRQHIIPVFQRPYSWSQKNWKELWSDIELLLEKGNENLEHFLGPIIIDKGDTGAYVPEKYLVIDGQQRLVTLSVILCALREIAEKHEDQDFASSVLPYLSFKTPRGEEYSRLVPRSDDRMAFRKVVRNNFETGDGKLQIVKAYRFFLRNIRKTMDSHGIAISDYLNKLFEIVVARLKFVSITLEKSDDPTRIYESMNSKGKDLLVADLIRNCVLMHLPAKFQDKFFDTQWERFEKQFATSGDSLPDSRELEDFYYRYLTAKRDYFAKRLVYAEYKEHMSEYFRASDADEGLLDSLGELVVDQEKFAKYYRRIIHPDLEPDKDLRQAFIRFNYLDALTATPLLMSLYDRYDCGENPNRIDKTAFIEMTDAVESFIIRRSILRLRTRGYGLDFAQAVRKSGNVHELLQHFNDKIWPDDDSIETALIEFPLYLRERKKARLILEELEKSFGHKEQPDIRNPSTIQTEHIMPRKEDISPAWKEMLGDNADEIHANYLHTLGNLTLSGYNQELGAKSFQDKQSVYADIGSNLELNKFVLEQERWTEAEITERARQLTARFIEIWPRPKTPNQSES